MDLVMTPQCLQSPGDHPSYSVLTLGSVCTQTLQTRMSLSSQLSHIVPSPAPSRPHNWGHLDQQITAAPAVSRPVTESLIVPLFSLQQSGKINWIWKEAAESPSVLNIRRSQRSSSPRISGEEVLFPTDCTLKYFCHWEIFSLVIDSSWVVCRGWRTVI